MPNLSAIPAHAVSLLSSLALFLEREAGHSLISLGCIWIGMLYLSADARSQMAHDVALIGIGYLGRGMGSAAKSTEPQ